MAVNETTTTSRKDGLRKPLWLSTFSHWEFSRRAGWNMTNFAMARLNMVESQVRPNGITDHRIIAAMSEVAREDFVPNERKSIAYLDEDVLLKAGSNGQSRYLIEPMAFARMAHLASIKPTDRVLVIGTGTGYGTKVIARLALSVVGLESDPTLVAEAKTNTADCDNVQIVEGTLAAGHAASGPFDVIVIEGRVAEIPGSLYSQLNNAGRIVAAVGSSDISKITLATLNDGHRSSRSAFDVSIAQLPGFNIVTPAFVF
jgi:protein-L-isoaspartate(D-aspartate) O-methyltransferase